MGLYLGFFLLNFVFTEFFYYLRIYSLSNNYFLIFQNSFLLSLNEVIFCIYIFIGFFFFLWTYQKQLIDKKIKIVSLYIAFLMATFCIYIGSLVLYYYYFKLFDFDSFYCFEGLLCINERSILLRIGISFFGLISLTIIHYLQKTIRVFTLEFSFFIALLYFIFVLATLCYNYFFVFILIELITLTLVIVGCLYSLFFSPKSLKPLIQFFVLNLIISAIFVLNLAILLVWYYKFDIGAYSYLPMTVEYQYWIEMFYYLDSALQIQNFELYEAIANKFITTWHQNPQQQSVQYWIELISQFRIDLSQNLSGPFTQVVPYLLGFRKITVFILCGILAPIFFKLTLAPFSVWVVNVYSKLPWFILFIFIIAYKIAYFAIFINIFATVFVTFELERIWQNFLIILIIASLFVGCIAFREQNLKKILAYTTISQIAFILIGVLCNSAHSLIYSFYYIGWYIFSIAGLIIIMVLISVKYEFENVNNLYLLKKINIYYYYILSLIFFSITGVPPLSGFFVKFFILIESALSGFFVITILGLVAGFLIAIIYLQILLQLTIPKSEVYNTLKISAPRIYYYNGDYISKTILHCCLIIVVFVNVIFII